MQNIKPNNIVILTGAGISAESGLKTFRDADGLWEGHAVEDVATPEGFQKDPELVHRFYNERRAQLSEVSPNKAHVALAEFEKKFSGAMTIVTQNVDDLHERAGSESVLHMHGELRKIRCTKTKEVYEWNEDIGVDSPNPHHPEIIGSLRPHIVWFGEMPFYLEQISQLLASCDLFVSIGTSGQVYPAAGFVQELKPTCQKIELNLEATQISLSFDKGIYGPASEIVPKFFRSLE